jgi:hypothetical protein
MAWHIVRTHTVTLGRVAWRYNAPWTHWPIAWAVQDAVRSSPIHGFQVAP